MSLDGYGSVYSSDTKTCGIRVDGGSWNTKSAAGMAKLSGEQKKKIHEATFRINHDSDGTRNFTIEVFFDMEITLDGTFYDRVNVGPQSFTLNRIPRASNMTSSASWTAGSNKTITISRYSSSFSHTIQIDVQDSGGTWRTIKTISTSGTSVSTSFSTSENTSIFNYINGRASAPSRMILTTKYGSTTIGSKTYTGTVTAPEASKITSFNGEATSNKKGFYVDQNMSLTITRNNSSFTHTVEITLGSYKKTITGVGTSVSWTPNSSEQNSMYGQMTTVKSRSATIRVITYYNGVQVRSPVNTAITYYVRESISKPTFSASNFTYQDTNSTTTALTGNNKIIIQNKSNLQVTISTAATPKNGATISKYEITINGVTKYLTGTGSISMGTVNASQNVTLSVKAIDSRGFSTVASQTVTMLPYAAPEFTVTGNRLNSFENSTTLTVTGKISLLTISGSNKNSIVTARWRQKESTVGTYGGWNNFTPTGSPNFSYTTTINLDNTKAFDIQVEITDKLSTVTKEIRVQQGRPILFIDAQNKAVGIGDFPDGEWQLKINGSIIFGATMWGAQTEGRGAIYLKNSDITGANGIWFNDVAQNNNAEGLLFLKSGKTEGSTNKDDYDNFIIRDGVAYINSTPIATETMQQLWSGAAFVHGSQTITPSKSLSNCKNGWILVWSDYNPGEGANDFDFVFTLIPKQFANINGTLVQCAIPNYQDASTIRQTVKKVYISNTQITGHNDNQSPTIYADDVVLRYVWEW